MKGLIIKDLMVLKSYARTILLFVVFYSAIGMMGGQVGLFASMSVMICILTTVTSFSYDFQARWDRYGASLPVTRRQMVGAKFLLSGILMLVGVVVMVLMFAGQYLINGMAADEMLGTVVGSIGASVIMISVLLPLIYKLGVEKSRFAMMAVVLLPTMAVLMIGYLNIPLDIDGDAVFNMLKYAGPVLLVLSVAVSYLISCRIFENKEL